MGCRVCRARKVKCDGRPNGCRNCERLQLDCVGNNGVTVTTAATTSPERRQSSSSSSLRKIRTYRSCTSCRLSKTKCNGDRPRCSRCAAKDIECVFDGGSSPRWTRNLNLSIKKEGDDDVEAHAGREKDASEPLEVEIGEKAMLQSPPSATTPAKAHTFSLESPDTLAWLLDANLPAPRHVRRLVEHYFANIHPIRCFAFVHKPSFMRQLDSGFNSDDDSALLNIICAHGAKFHAMSLAQFDQTPSPAFLRAAGNQWAKKAETILLESYGKISTHRLMAAVLLYDFRFRVGDYGQALMLSGLAIRMAQALRIYEEHSPDIMCTDAGSAMPSVVTRESRRRLMWACYILDVWSSSSVNSLTLWRETDIKVQLPCNERNFGLRIPSVTETLAVGHVLQSLSPAIVPPKPAENMGIMAYYIRVTTLRKRILKYINSTEGSSAPPWSPESEFAALDADLRRWRRELPDFVEYSPDTIYARLDSNQLGGLMLIHCTYHHNYLELYKVSMPDLFRLRPASAFGSSVFPPEHAEILQALQADCYFHARQIAHLVAEASEHGIRLLSDSVLPFFILDSSRIMLYYVARLLDPERVDAAQRVQEAMEAVESNKKLLQMMAPLLPISESFYMAIDRWLNKVKRRSPGSVVSSAIHSDDLNVATDIEMSSIASNSAKSASEFTLPPIMTHRAPLASPSSDNPLPSGRPGFSRSTSWTAVNDASTSHHENTPPSRGGRDHQTAAQQLVGLSRAATPPDGQTKSPICEALDIDDLQSFLSWNIPGVMDVGDTATVSEYETDGMKRSSEWASTV